MGWPRNSAGGKRRVGIEIRQVAGQQLACGVGAKDQMSFGIDDDDRLGEGAFELRFGALAQTHLCFQGPAQAL